MPAFTGGLTIGSGINFTNDPTPITATAGSITSVSGITSSAITAFFPFATVQNGTPPYTYFVSAGVLPSGITLNSSNGIVSGKPTAGQALGNVTFSVRDSNFVSAATTATVGFTITQATYAINYLVVAGGGGGGGVGTPGAGGAGGGAGGLLTGSLCFILGSSISITVGGGGAAGTSGPGTCGSGYTNGGNGTDSTISGSGFSTVTAIGGGGGGRANGFVGAPGGSGGGTSKYPAVNPLSNPGNPTGGGSGFNFPGPTQQGYPGGGWQPANNPGSPGSGGGGAGGYGQIAPPASLDSGGAGGVAYLWPITGSYYAGGGGGGSSLTPPMAVGLGGGTATASQKGGGGNGGLNTPYIAAVAGTTNTGGGGGGAAYRSTAPNFVPGAAGGSGVVIFAVPTPFYPGSAPGATVSTPPAAPGQTVLTYNAPATYIA